jgi:hypothetical protein
LRIFIDTERGCNRRVENSMKRGGLRKLYSSSNYYWHDGTVEDKMGRTYSMQRGNEKCIHGGSFQLFGTQSSLPFSEAPHHLTLN